MLKIDGVTHWSIPVNDLEESERFYRDLLGLEYRGRLGNSRMACFHVGGHDILLCERKEKLYRTPQQDNRLHHSFTLSPEEWEKAVRLFHERGVKVEELSTASTASSPAASSTSSILRATCSRFVIRPGRRGWLPRRSRTSLARACSSGDEMLLHTRPVSALDAPPMPRGTSDSSATLQPGRTSV